MKKIIRDGRGPAPLPGIAALGAALLIPLTGCDLDKVLSVDDPEYPTGLSLDVIAAGAIGDFQRSYAGGMGGPAGTQQGFHDEGYVTVSAAFTDETHSTGTFETRVAHDQRSLRLPSQDNTSDAPFILLQRARISLAEAARLAADTEGVGPTAPIRGRLLALEGFTYTALGEGFCGAVPFSGEEGGEFVYGEPQSTGQVFEHAVERFDAALGTTGFAHLAAVGKGRALLNLGRYQEAAAAVAGVPTDFVYFVEHSANTPRQYNNVHGMMDNGRWAQSNRLGGNGMPFREGDPRSPWVLGKVNNPDDTQGFEQGSVLYTSVKYPSSSENVVLADGIEARLIEAEAAFHAGGDWLGILNSLRADYRALLSARLPNYEVWLAEGTRSDRDPANPRDVQYHELTPLTDPETDAARVDLIFQERAFWMYLTGHRLGDLRRLVRQYGRSADSVFPSGAYHKGDVYGNDVSLPLPFDEVNNPHFESEDHMMQLCDTTVA